MLQPPPQSRLLQYRQSQTRASGEPSSSLAPLSNHAGPFPAGLYSHETGRNLLNENLLNNPALYPNQPPAQSGGSSPPPSNVKYLLQEAQWSHGGAASVSQQNHLLGNQSHSLLYGLPLMAHPSRPEQQQNQGPDSESYHPLSPRTSAAAALHSIDEYEPRGPGRPLYQRRISSSYPDESSPAHPCHPEPQDHPQQPHGSYTYPPHDHLWPSNGGGPGPFQNIPCNGASKLVQHRELLASKVHRQTDEQVKAEPAGAQQQAHPHNLNSLQHQFPPLMPNKKQQQPPPPPPPPPQPPTEPTQGAPSLVKPPTMSYASALRAPPKPRAVRPEQVKKNSDPLSLLQELSIGSSNGSNGYYSYFK
uniref:Uncharacterized protein n=1 Tax=Xiphophorus couchianus TaxID=32473 RepID=A0A3B5M6H5_9TELE